MSARNRRWFLLVVVVLGVWLVYHKWTRERGLAFDALPEMERVRSELLADDGNVFLYVVNTAHHPAVVDIRVTIDGKVAVQDAFKWDVPIQFTRYRIQLAPGTHQLVVASERGKARLEETIHVNDQLHIGMNYNYRAPSLFSPEAPPCFILHADEKEGIPDYAWKNPP